MNKTVFTSILALMSLPLIAQSVDNGEVWEPVPAKVTGFANSSPPPSDAIVLFDGTNLDAWITAESEQDAAWDISDGAMTVTRGKGTIKTRQAFSDMQLHVEWRPTDVIQGNGQGRGNSGVFLHSLYELQVLDSWNNPTYVNGQAGSIYKQVAPLVNAANAPGQWQSFDILFKAPVYNDRDELASPAIITVMQNGIVIHNQVEILGSTFTPAPMYEARCAPYSQDRIQDCSGKMPITLQDHGQIVSYRNIWVRPL
jgi:hypothetical protein